MSSSSASTSRRFPLLVAGLVAVLLGAACSQPPDPAALERASVSLRRGMTEAEVRAVCAGATADIMPDHPNRTLQDGRQVRLLVYYYGPRIGKIEVAYDSEGKAVGGWVTDFTRPGTPPRLLFD